MRLPILVVHICAGLVGLLAGAGAMSFRKGSRRHALAGNVFFVAMVVMGSSAAILGNVFGGLFAVYLVTTSWLTARRREGRNNIFDWSLLLFVLGFGTWMLWAGVQVARNPSLSYNGVPAGMFGMFFFLGSVALLAAAGDIRMLARGGVSGRQRIVRHLWRMCFSFFIATGSFFIGQPQVFPAFIRKTNLLFIPGILPLLMMIFWLIRVHFKNAYKMKSVPGTGDAQSLTA